MVFVDLLISATTAVAADERWCSSVGSSKLMLLDLVCAAVSTPLNMGKQVLDWVVCQGRVLQWLCPMHVLCPCSCPIAAAATAVSFYMLYSVVKRVAGMSSSSLSHPIHVLQLLALCVGQGDGVMCDGLTVGWWDV